MTDEVKYKIGAGWAGVMRHVLHYLRTVGADQDEEGNFLIGGPGVMSFMGMSGENAEVVVPAETVYFVNGRQAPLAAGLNATSYGLRGVTVIC